MISLFRTALFKTATTPLTVIARCGLAFSMMVTLYLSLIPIESAPFPGVSDKIQHLSAFLVLALLADNSFPKKPHILGKTAALMTYGLTIELLQLQTDYRTFSTGDLLADLSGIALYFLLSKCGTLLFPDRILNCNRVLHTPRQK